MNLLRYDCLLRYLIYFRKRNIDYIKEILFLYFLLKEIFIYWVIFKNVMEKLVIDFEFLKLYGV